MGCGGSKGVGEELDEVCQAVVNGEGIAGYTVAGAGTKHVDGTYLRDGTYKGAPVFKNGQVWLVRWSDDDWYLADKDKLDSAVGDFYSVEDDAMLPPAHGWSVLNDGAEPAPTLSAIAEGPAAFVVSGAGDAHANGTYRRDGTHEGSPLYVKDNLWLARCRYVRGCAAIRARAPRKCPTDEPPARRQVQLVSLGHWGQKYSQ